MVCAFFQHNNYNIVNMKEKTLFHQLTDLFCEAVEMEIQKKEC